MNTYWMSFSNPNIARGFLGVIITDATSPHEALQKTRKMGLNPGGEVKIFQLKNDATEDYTSYKDRLLKREDLKDIGVSTLDNNTN